MMRIIEAAGFRLASRRRTPAWSSDVFVSTSESTDGDRQWHTSKNDFHFAEEVQQFRGDVRDGRGASGTVTENPTAVQSVGRYR